MFYLLTGGSGCGKSAYAERLLMGMPAPRYYIAAMIPYGEDGPRKVEKHRRQREGKGFVSIERYTDLAGLILPETGSALLECVCNLTANEMFEPDGAGDGAEDAVLRGVDRLREQCRDIVVVTNDVGSAGLSGYGEGTLRYMRTLGRVNRLLARRADAVAELAAGIPLWLKGGLPEGGTEI